MEKDERRTLSYHIKALWRHERRVLKADFGEIKDEINAQAAAQREAQELAQAERDDLRQRVAAVEGRCDNTEKKVEGELLDIYRAMERASL